VEIVAGAGCGVPHGAQAVSTRQLRSHVVLTAYLLDHDLTI